MKKRIWLSLFGGTGTGIIGIFGLSICCLPVAAGFSGILGTVAVLSYKYSIYFLMTGVALLFISFLLFTKRKKLKLKSTITCPNCNKEIIEKMPTNSCLFFYDCPKCKKTIRPKKGDCCVFCSYGDNPCPPKQQKCNC